MHATHSVAYPPTWWLSDKLVCWPITWISNILAGCLTHGLPAWSTGCMYHWLTHWLMHSLVDSLELSGTHFTSKPPHHFTITLHRITLHHITSHHITTPHHTIISHHAMHTTTPHHHHIATSQTASATVSLHTQASWPTTGCLAEWFS